MLSMDFTILIFSNGIHGSSPKKPLYENKYRNLIRLMIDDWMNYSLKEISSVCWNFNGGSCDIWYFRSLRYRYFNDFNLNREAYSRKYFRTSIQILNALTGLVFIGQAMLLLHLSSYINSVSSASYKEEHESFMGNLKGTSMMWERA